MRNKYIVEEMNFYLPRYHTITEDME